MDESRSVRAVPFQAQQHENVVAVNATTANPNTVQAAGRGSVRPGPLAKDDEHKQRTLQTEHHPFSHSKCFDVL
jgi:hypothetical protein